MLRALVGREFAGVPTSGIGRRTAEIFVREGAKVVATGRREELGRTLEASLGKDKCIFVKADATKEADVKAKGIDLSKLLYSPAVGPEVGRFCTETQDHGLEKGLDLSTVQGSGPGGRIIKTGPKSLALELESRGYDWLSAKPGADAGAGAAA